LAALVFAVLPRLPLVVGSGGYSPVAVYGLVIVVGPLVVAQRPWGTGSVVVVQGLVSNIHVKSSWTSD